MESLKQSVAERIAAAASMPVAEVLAALEYPPDPTLGDLAFPCFPLAKVRRQAPPKIAADLAAALAPGAPVAAWRAAGPYLNVELDAPALARAVLDRVSAAGERYGHGDACAGQRVVIDYSAPNIGKAIAFHHLRSTMIGNALVRILRAQGATVTGVNHLGDWGTQFGFLLDALADRVPDQIRRLNIGQIHELYAAANARAGSDPSVRERARAAFAALESGDPDRRARWEACRDVSRAAFDRLYARLGVTFEAHTGESFYEAMLGPLIAELEAAGTATPSDGALIVDLAAQGIATPLLLRKADGATLYATRDLAAARYRHATYRFDRCLYVTDQGQALHFRQLFATLQRMGHAWAAGMQHVPFGVLLIWDEEASEWTRGKSRAGRVVLLEEVLDEAARRVQAVIADKNPDLADAATVAEQVGVGAVIFNDLKNRREKDVHFRFEEALNFEGDAGPYVQNAHVRACGILRKSGGAFDPGADAAPLAAPEERALLLQVARFPEAPRRAALDLEPHHVAGALLEVSAALHRFYHHRRVLDADTPGLRTARLRLIDAVRVTLRNGLTLLGIAAPEEM